MNHARVTAVALILVCAGCARTEIQTYEASGLSVSCCLPEFSIMFTPENRDGLEPDVSITEEERNVIVTRGNRKRVTSRTREYKELRDLILRYPQWREGAQTPYIAMPSSGPPRDILTVTHRESGLNLQGDSVPIEWKKRILRLSRLADKRSNKKLNVLSDRSTPRENETESVRK